MSKGGQKDLLTTDVEDRVKSQCQSWKSTFIIFDWDQLISSLSLINFLQPIGYIRDPPDLFVWIPKMSTFVKGVSLVFWIVHFCNLEDDLGLSCRGRSSVTGLGPTTTSLRWRWRRKLLVYTNGGGGGLQQVYIRPTTHEGTQGQRVSELSST